MKIDLVIINSILLLLYFLLMRGTGIYEIRETLDLNKFYLYFDI